MSRRTEFFLPGPLTAWLLAGCAGYAATVLYTADARTLLALASSYPQHWASTPAQVGALRLLLAGVALALTGAGCALARRGEAGISLQLAGRGLLRGWRCLAPRQQQIALAAFGALTALRLVVSRGLATFDDRASYEFFVRKSLLTVSACYPAPNNHVFSNTLSWLFYQVYPGYWWSMRVPVLLLSTVGTAGWFLGLLRRSNFRVAALATTLFSMLELSLFYAAEGRGYALLLVLSGLGFFCVLSLTSPVAAPVALGQAWAGLAVAGVLGLYTVPTFAYFLVAAYGWLGVCWLGPGQRQRLVGLGWLAATTLLGVGLLYTPLLLVSGPGALFKNAYVKPLPVPAFLQQLPAYVWRVEGALLGESHNGVLASLHLGSLAAVAVLAGIGALLAAARRGRLSAPQAAVLMQLGQPALWFAVMPYALLLTQRVLAPDRALWFKAAFMFLLVGLLADWLLQRLGPNARLLRSGLLLGAGLWAGAQLIQLHRSNELRLSYLRPPHAAARWLLHQPPGPILAAGPAFTVAAVQFFIHLEDPASSLAIDAVARPGIRYRYFIGPRAAAPRPAATLPGLHIDRGATSDAIDIAARW